MTTSTTRNKLIKNKFVRCLLAAVFWLAVWEALALWADMELILPTPFAVFFRVFELITTNAFLSAVGMSVLRIFSGFAAAVIIGALLGALSCRFSVIDVLFSPLMTVIRATPVASVIILMLVWLSRGSVPPIISFMMVVPIIWSNVRLGISSVPNELHEMCEVYEIKPKKRLKLLYIPAVLPSFRAGIRISLGLAWKAGIAAEVLCNPALSLGGLLYEAKLYIETVDVFAVTLVIILLSFFLEKVILKLMREKGESAK